jgi:hypothetical protein
MKESRNKQMSRLEALDRLFKYQDAMENGEFKLCCNLVGITDEMAEDMTHDEIMQAMAVRFSDMCRIAGVIE